MIDYKYKNRKFIKNGHTMFEQDVLTDLKRLSYLEEQAEKLRIGSVSQQRELLNSLAEEFNDSTHTYVGQPMIEKILKEFNCG